MRRIVKRNMVLVYMHEIVKQVAWVGHCSFYTVFLQLTYFCVITFCFLFWNLDSWRLALQSLLSWWRHRDAQDADGWSCRVWRWNSCNRGPGNSHSLQPAPWNQVWALHYIERMMHYTRMQILDGQRCCLILVMGGGTWDGREKAGILLQPLCRIIFCSDCQV